MDTPEKKARLQHFAARTGRSAGDLVAEAVDRMLPYDTRFMGRLDSRADKR
jgi:hypothetical protein